MWALLGTLAGAVAITWLVLGLRRRSAVVRRARCPECDGDLRGYDQSPTCPHCFAILNSDDEDDDDQEPGSVDEIDEDYEEPERW